MPRTVIVGDLHGCRAELDALLSRVGFTEGDRLVMVGDLVVRGPDPVGALDLLASVRARAVRGNHEDRLLRARGARAGVARAGSGEAQRATIARLSDRHWAFLGALPLWLDLPEHGVRVVHAGVVPGVPIEQQDPRALMYMRCVDATGAALEKRGPRLWGARYHGEPHVVFGHNAAEDPQLHADATGLDTGCVYGGRLTALVLSDGERPPRAAERTEALVSVRARKRYADD
jgi:hypothetical protein